MQCCGVCTTPILARVRYLTVGASFAGALLSAALCLRSACAVAAASPCAAPQFFFTGSAVLMNALGGHAIATEMMDVMETPKQYTVAYTGGWLWTIFLVVPHSIAVNLAWPLAIGKADNVYGILPMSK